MKFETEADFIAYKKAVDNAAVEAMLDHITPKTDNAKLNKLEAVLEKTRQNILESWKYIRLDFIRTKAEFDFLETVPGRISAAEPYFYLNIPNREIPNLSEFYKANFTDEWEIKEDSQYKKILEQLIDTKAEGQIKVKPTKEVGVALDKLSLITYGGEMLNSGQQYRIDTLGDGGGNPVMLLMNFDELDGLDFKTTRHLDYYDELVSTAAAALWRTNGLFSESQICKVMGLSNSKQNRENVRRSMEKQRLTIMKINNIREAENSKYPPFKYDAQVLPFERIDTVVNGKPTIAIRLLDEPPLQKFSRERKQFITIKRELLAVPDISKTRRNIGLIMYFLKNISHLKNGNRNPIFLKATLLSEFKITATHKKEFFNMIKKILDHFVKEKFIHSYTNELDRIIITVSKQVANKRKKKLKG